MDQGALLHRYWPQTRWRLRCKVAGLQLIHCSAGRRRSAMLAPAVLRLRGHDRTRAEELVLSYRTEAELVPA